MSPITVQDLRAWCSDAALPSDEVAMVDELRGLEELKCAAEARQARIAVVFDRSQRQRAADAGVPVERQGRGVAEQIALARRISPHRGRQLLGLAKILDAELPCTRAAFDAGRVSEWRTTIMARETGCLELRDRQTIDATLAGDPVQLESLGDRELAGRVRAMAIELDNASVARRAAKAASERTVTIRPAPDAMVYLTALLPVAKGIGVYAALKRHADEAVGTGAATSRGQAMADALVSSVLGESGMPPVCVNVVVPADALLGGDGPGRIDDTPIAPGTVRQLITEAADAGVDLWLRRLYARPADGALVTMESRQRLFPNGLAEFLRLRDRTCRTPWCDAPVRHFDHVESADAGGDTSVANGQGLCEQCNHAKQGIGWRSKPINGPDEPHTVQLRTPTGHTYQSRAPAVA